MIYWTVCVNKQQWALPLTLFCSENTDFTVSFSHNILLFGPEPQWKQWAPWMCPVLYQVSHSVLKSNTNSWWWDSLCWSGPWLAAAIWRFLHEHTSLFIMALWRLGLLFVHTDIIHVVSRSERWTSQTHWALIILIKHLMNNYHMELVSDVSNAIDYWLYLMLMFRCWWASAFIQDDSSSLAPVKASG